MFTVKAIIPDSPAINPEALLQAVNLALDESAKEVKGEFETTIESWNEKPSFTIESAQMTRQIYTVNQIYDWVNNGTEPHEILPVRAQALRFYTGGIAKTAIGSLGSRPGAEGGNLVFAKSAMNPGITAREFDRVIWERWLDILPARIQAAIDKAA